MELIKKSWLAVLEFLGLHHPEKKVPTFTQVNVPSAPVVKESVAPVKKAGKKTATPRKKTTKKKAE